MTDPLSVLSPYLSPAAHQDADYCAALRIAEACVSGRRAPSLADWSVFAHDPSRVVKAISDQVLMPADAQRVSVYEALGTLRDLLDL
jgi:hypothetical protein